MADWDENSEKLSGNLEHILRALRKESHRRQLPTVEDARQWQHDIMDGLVPEEPHYVGRFRGEAGLEDIAVIIGSYYGSHPDDVAEELNKFERKLQQIIIALDQRIPPDKMVTASDLADILDLCAWVHSEWVRIHPFANGNGRTARLWANAMALRYRLPPFIRLRPRPDGGYGDAAEKAMSGDWQSSVPIFQQMLAELIES